MVKTMPGSIAAMLPIITCGASWTSRPRPWPVLVRTRSPKPASRRLSVTRRSRVVEGHRRRGDACGRARWRRAPRRRCRGASALGGADEEGAGDVGVVAAAGGAEVERAAAGRARGGARGSGCRAGRRRRRRRARSGRRRGRRRRVRASRRRGAGGSRSRVMPAAAAARAAARARLADRDRPAEGGDLGGVLVQAHAGDGGVGVEDGRRRGRRGGCASASKTRMRWPSTPMRAGAKRAARARKASS